MNKPYKLMGILPIILLAVIFVSVIPSVSSDSGAINTFLKYEDTPSATSKTVTQGDSINLVLVAYGHGEQLSYEKLELVSATLIFQENVAGDQILEYTWLYSKTYTLNTAILNPGDYTLRFTAKTKTTQSEEYSDLDLIILPKVVPPRCGDGQCNGDETCSTCSTDCGVCPDTTNPVVHITNPIATIYSSQRTSLTFNVNDENLNSCTYKLNGALPVNIPSVSNGQNTVTGITSITGINTWKVTCRDDAGNTGSDTVIFTVTIPPRCGDGQCNGAETCSTCSTDCGVCPPRCGDGQCNGAETCSTCSSDCGVCSPRCGDGQCNGDETCSTCSTDCGVCPPTCDLTNAHWSVSSTLTGQVISLIVQGSNCNGKTIDFAVYQDKPLGDLYVTNTATAIFSSSNSVSSNWVAIAPLNGDTTPTYYFIAKVIGSSESATSGYLDVTIPPRCGDGQCNGAETCSTCSADCGACTPTCGDRIKEGTEQCDDGNTVNGDGCSSSCMIEEQKECILQLTKSVDKTNVQPGDIVTFTLKYKNIGDGACTGGGVKIQEILNSNLDYTGSYTKTLTGDSDGQSLSYGWQTTSGFDESTNTITWNAHVVSPGEEGTIRFSAKILQPENCGDFQIGNYFKIWSNEKGWQNSNTINILVDNNCYQPSCGNHILDSGEQCDDGNLLNNDGCSSTCKTEICGDNICNHGETCLTCSTDCGVCPPRCGDRQCNGAETCSTCPSDCGACAPVCGPVCGNGKLEGTEQCDDGNKVSGDGCSSTCQTEIAKECILQLSKSVNKSNVKPGDIVTFTLKYKNIGNGECTGGGAEIQDVLNSNLDVIAYSKGVTGDSDTQGISFGYYEIPVFNEATNTLTFNAHTVSSGEEGTIMISTKILEPSQCGDFQISNYFKIWSNEKGWQNSNTLKLYVDDDCYLPVCGNHILDTGEQCDDGNKLNNDGCSSTCKLEVCGDHICNHAETCSTCSQDCGVCQDTTKPVVDITNPIATTYTSQITRLTFTVYDEHLNSCTYKLNGALPVNIPSVSNGQNTVTGITSITGINTWKVTCRDDAGNTGSDTVIFTVTIPPRCGDGQCNGAETCSTCSTDCGVCLGENCHTCKDSKPLDQSGDDYYYYLQNKKPTVISEETTATDLNLDLGKNEKSVLQNKFPLIALILIISVLILLIFIIILRLVRRR